MVQADCRDPQLLLSQCATASAGVYLQAGPKIAGTLDPKVQQCGSRATDRAKQPQFRNFSDCALGFTVPATS